MPVITPYIPQMITVHLGRPDSNAQNVTVSFSDYIKNVAASEIYPTWSLAAIYANVYAQISFALNRVYTEFYPSRGYNFEITSSTANDQQFVYGRTFFSRTSDVVDEIFDEYIRRIGTVEPLAAKYCNGTTVTCEGLSQWGSEYMAREGATTMDILKSYYGDDIEIVVDAPIRGITRSYPGSPLRVGSSGDNVAVIQTELNRISRNYPSIPKINPVDGVFGSQMENSVKRFQQIFNLTADGIVGKATWYKLISIYVGMTKLSELDSEGQRFYNISLEYPDAISYGDEGEKVRVLQYFLSVISSFNSFIPPLVIDGKFGEQTKNAVIAFQKQNDLKADGIVGRATWDAIYASFIAIARDIYNERDIFRVPILPYPGEVLTEGASGEDVRALQTYILAIGLVNDNIPVIEVTGTYNPQTTAAVKAFQKEFGFEVTGNVDRETWNAIVSTYRAIESATLTHPEQYGGVELQMGDSDERTMYNG